MESVLEPDCESGAVFTWDLLRSVGLLNLASGLQESSLSKVKYDLILGAKTVDDIGCA